MVGRDFVRFVSALAFCVATGCSKSTPGDQTDPGGVTPPDVDEVSGDGTVDAPPPDGPALDVEVDADCLGKQVGESCDDGDPCTDGDRCTAEGLCAGTTSTVCPNGAGCEVGYCEKGVGCKTKLAEEGSICKLACYGLSFCTADGKCEPDKDTVKICEPKKGSCEDTVVCNNSTGECDVVAMKQNGAACDADSDACTIDKCDEKGDCLKTKEDPCLEQKVSITGQCSNWTCLSPSGKCAQAGSKPDGAGCDDTDKCTSPDKCFYDATVQFSKCQGQPIEIDDKNPCTSDNCTIAGEITHEITSGAVCPGDVCDDTGTCSAAGVCEYNGCECNDDKQCASDPCKGKAYCDKTGPKWMCKFDSAEAYSCQQPTNPCQIAVCDSTMVVAGKPDCKVQNKSDGVVCDDKDYCNESDVCTGGKCVKVDPAKCDDAVFCNGLETCQVGECVEGTPPTLDDAVPCTTDACDDDIDQVTHTPDHAKCQDPLFCNGAEVCDPKLDCQPGPLPTVDDGVPCTTDACDEDANKITHKTDDKACDDSEYCTTEYCDLTAGCKYTSMKDGTDCGGKDDDPCSTQEKCAAGVCEGKDCGDVGMVCAGTTCAKVKAVTFRAVSVSDSLSGSGHNATVLVNSTASDDLSLPGELKVMLSYLAQWLGYKE